MAKYNTFLVVNCSTRVPVLVTSSARKADSELAKGKRIEVWNENELVEKIYAKNRKNLGKYKAEEKEYIRQRQARAEESRKRQWTNKLKK